MKIAAGIVLAARRLIAAGPTSLWQIIEGFRKTIETKPKQPFRLRDGSFGSGGVCRQLTWDDIRDDVYRGRGA